MLLVVNPKSVSYSNTVGVKLIGMNPAETIRAAREARDMSQADLGRAISPKVPVSQSTIDKIERGLTKKSKWFPAIAAVLEIPLAKIDPDMAALGGPQTGLQPIPDRPHSADANFPVYASAEGGPGEILVTTDPAGWIPTPSPVERVAGAYGLYVVGTSMEPEFEAGDVALVNPHLPVIPGGTYIFYAERDGAARATIKRLRRATTDSWLVRQHNPPEGQKQDFTLSRKEWTVCHRVFGKHSPV